jgi:hypothetical protein
MQLLVLMYTEGGCVAELFTTNGNGYARRDNERTQRVM